MFRYNITNWCVEKGGAINDAQCVPNIFSTWNRIVIFILIDIKVICIHDWLHTLVEKNMTVRINELIRSGLLSLEMELSEEPVLGEWKIETVINFRKETQTFTVEEYGKRFASGNLYWINWVTSSLSHSKQEETFPSCLRLFWNNAALASRLIHI